MLELRTAFALIVVLALALSYFFFCRYRNRRDFLANLQYNQTVRFGQEERIGRIVRRYKTYARIVDLKDGSYNDVRYTEIYPL